MPILIYKDSDGHQKEYSFSDEISIGSDPERCGIVLPEELGVAPWHAVIIRSALNRVPLLVNLGGQNTWANDRPVVCIQVLRQRDRLRLGQAGLTMWEVRITTLDKSSRFIGKECQVCKSPFSLEVETEEEREVVICPRCSLATHRDCWFYVERCPTQMCGYPARESLIDALSPWVSFERYLKEGSELVEVKDEKRVIKEGKKCQALERADQVPFQVGDQVAYCPSPSCRATYHLDCWLRLKKCRLCGYDIKKLVDQVFSVSSEDVPETGDVYAR